MSRLGLLRYQEYSPRLQLSGGHTTSGPLSLYWETVRDVGIQHDIECQQKFVIAGENFNGLKFL